MPSNLAKLAHHFFQLKNPTNRDLITLQKSFPKAKGYYTKMAILAELKKNKINLNQSQKQLLTVRPVRTASGVAPLTVLTKPYPCPGACIFCPSDIRMPKSYLSKEPGAQRAANNRFDPYLQTYNRLQAFKNMGHPFSKVELLVLGGTWSVYPLTYRLWFIKRLFDALNDFGTTKDSRSKVEANLTLKLPSQSASKIPYNQAVSQTYSTELHKPSETATWAELYQAHRLNETALVRCVGLVLETRPDYITPTEVKNLRRLGATKIQIGIQSLQPAVLAKNKRGHTVQASIQAIALLRQAGFKLHLHWMPNLLGSNPALDLEDYRQIFSNPAFRPDEIKIYPTSLIVGTELMTEYQAGHWRPYTQIELLKLLTQCLALTPRYCRISRMIRDIPSQDIVVGNKTTNFREIAEKSVQGKIQDIRAREIRHQKIHFSQLKLKSTRYTTTISTEYFLEWVTPQDQIAGFLRLSLPCSNETAIIREVHIYGQAINLGASTDNNAQHRGLGKTLIQQAIKICKRLDYRRLLVISAIGTRPYYRKLGFTQDKLYQSLSLDSSHVTFNFSN